MEAETIEALVEVQGEYVNRMAQRKAWLMRVDRAINGPEDASQDFWELMLKLRRERPDLSPNAIWRLTCCAWRRRTIDKIRAGLVRENAKKTSPSLYGTHDDTVESAVRLREALERINPHDRAWLLARTRDPSHRARGKSGRRIREWAKQFLSTEQA